MATIYKKNPCFQSAVSRLMIFGQYSASKSMKSFHVFIESSIFQVLITSESSPVFRIWWFFSFSGGGGTKRRSSERPTVDSCGVSSISTFPKSTDFWPQPSASGMKPCPGDWALVPADRSRCTCGRPPVDTCSAAPSCPSPEPSAWSGERFRVRTTPLSRECWPRWCPGGRSTHTPCPERWRRSSVCSWCERRVEGQPWAPPNQRLKPMTAFQTTQKVKSTDPF